MQGIIENTDDARAFLAAVLGQLVVVVAMMGIGLIWGMVWGWLLTLVSIAICPVFVAVIALQAGLVAKCEVRNKRAPEEVAGVSYEVRLLFLSSLLSNSFSFTRTDDPQRL